MGVKIIRAHKGLVLFVGPYVTAISWSRIGTFGVWVPANGRLRFSRLRFWLARYWSGIGRWADEDDYAK